jgi:GR25 family glycosyltransferase involved in LPS biosynthesis
MSILDDVQFYCVCLVNRPERIESLNKIKEVIPDIEVIEALDGKFLTKEDIMRYKEEGFLLPKPNGKYTDDYIKGRPLNVGNVGSFITHRNAMKAISKQKKKFGVVIEDDVVLLDGFLENLENIIEHVKDVEFDLIHLYVFESQRNIFPKDKQNLVKTPIGLWGLQLYMMKNTHADKVYKSLFPMLGATDEQITRMGLNGYVLTGLELIKGEVIKSYTTTTKTINALVAEK